MTRKRKQHAYTGNS